MTEAEWLKGASAAKLFAAVPAGVSERKLRLFVCGCWREYHRRCTSDGKRVRDKKHLVDLLAAVEAGESLADGVPAEPPRGVEIWYATMADVPRAAQGTAGDNHLSRRKIAAGLVRDVFGNPFRPAALDPAWLTSTAVALAQGIYADRAFDRMPILADALQDAGCENEDVLKHCRDEKQVHVRGCWVIDLLLGKS